MKLSLIILLTLISIQNSLSQNTVIQADSLYKTGNFEKAMPIYKLNLAQLDSKQLFRYANSISRATNTLDENWFSLIKKAADLGLDSAQLELGNIYLQADSVKQQEEGFILAEKAGQQGLVTAQILLASNYILLKKDSLKADYWYNRAIAKNDREGLYAYGDYLYNHKQVEKAIPLLIKSADLKQPYAANILAGYYTIIKPDSTQALLYNMAYIKNDTVLKEYNSGYCNLANLYLEGKIVKQDTLKALYYFNEAITKKIGRSDAARNLYDNYFSGKYLKKDYAKALKYAELQCEDFPTNLTCKIPQNFANDLLDAKEYDAAIVVYNKYLTKLDSNDVNLLGMCYWNQKKYTEAFTFFKQGAAMGNDVAMINVGNNYYHGWGIDTNYVEAVKWFNMAAEKKNASAITLLGLCYDTGKGLPIDKIKAAEQFKLATDLGDNYGMYWLAQYYLYGQGGLKRDLIIALNLLEKACNPDLNFACKEAGDLKKKIEEDKNTASF